MVKPQFEVGRDLVGGGVVRDPELRAAAVTAVAAAAAGLGLGVAGVTASPLPGPSGNVEYFLWLRRGAPALDEDTLRAGDRGGAAVTASQRIRRRAGRVMLLVAHTGQPAALRVAQRPGRAG